MQAHIRDQHQGAVSYVAHQDPMLELALLYHRLDNATESGAPLSFLEMPFLVQPYTDMPDLQHMVVRKCTQVGWTTLLVVFAFMQAMRGRKHAVVLPDDDVVKGFIQDELDPLLARVAFYGNLQRVARGRSAKTADNMRIKHLARGTWRFVGSKKAAKLRMFRTDSILVDEVDECLQTWLGMVHDRVLASAFPQKFWLGNPRLPERGITKMFAGTDQRHWFHRCTRCGHRQRVDWFRSVVEQVPGGGWRPRDRERAQGLSEADEIPEAHRDIRPVCVRCERPWDRTAEGCCWVAKHPLRIRRGYTVAQMDHLGRRLWPMFLRWVEAQGNPDLLVTFYAGGLGYAFEPPGGKLTDTDIADALGGWPMDYIGGEQYREPVVTCGVDVGAALHVKISVLEERPSDPSDPDSDPMTVRREVWKGTLQSWDALEDLYKRYHVNVSVVDSEPGGMAIKEHRERVNTDPDSPTIVWLWRHKEQARITPGAYGLTLNEVTGEANGCKHQLLDATTADIRQGRREFAADSLQVLTWLDHMQASTRMLVVVRGVERYRWSRGTKRDDYRMADAHDRVAADVWATGPSWSELTIRHR